MAGRASTQAGLGSGGGPHFNEIDGHAVYLRGRDLEQPSLDRNAGLALLGAGLVNEGLGMMPPKRKATVTFWLALTALLRNLTLSSASAPSILTSK